MDVQIYGSTARVELPNIERLQSFHYVAPLINTSTVPGHTIPCFLPTCQYNPDLRGIIIENDSRLGKQLVVSSRQERSLHVSLGSDVLTIYHPHHTDRDTIIELP